jgi:ribosome-binding factor A
MKKLPYARSDRIKKILHRELAVLMSKLKDPRAEFITITEVKLSSDLRNATVYYTVVDKNNIENVKSMFESAKGYIKSQIAKKLNLKNAIDIRFEYDKFLARATNVLFLLDKIKEDEQSSK